MYSNTTLDSINFGYAQSATSNGSCSDSGTKSFSFGVGKPGYGASQTVGKTIIVGSINNN